MNELEQKRKAFNDYVVTIAGRPMTATERKKLNRLHAAFMRLWKKEK